ALRGSGAVACGRALVRGSTPPLATRVQTDRHRHRHAGHRDADHAQVSRRAAGPGDMLALSAAGALTALALLGWLWGGLAGELFGTGWPTVHVAEMPGVLSRLPTHLGDPAGAWPRSVRAELPDPAGAYAALAILLALIAVPSAVALRARGAW